jgi:hypothetical protein
MDSKLNKMGAVSQDSNPLFQSRALMVTALREKSTHDVLRTACQRREERKFRVRAYLQHLRLLSRRLTARLSAIESSVVELETSASGQTIERALWRKRFYEVRKVIWQLQRARVLTAAMAPLAERRLAHRLFDLQAQRLDVLAGRLVALRHACRRPTAVTVEPPLVIAASPRPRVMAVLIRRFVAWLNHSHVEIGVGRT